MQEITDELKELGLNEQKESGDISFSSKVQHSIFQSTKKIPSNQEKLHAQNTPEIVVEGEYEDEDQLFNYGEVNNKAISDLAMRESFGFKQPNEQENRGINDNK